MTVQSARIPKEAAGTILCLTGPLHSGKTTFLKETAGAWTALGIEVGGYLSEARRRGRGIAGYDLIDLRTGASVPFLRKAGDSGPPSVGSFRVLPPGLRRAGAIIARDRGRDVVIIDEFGPLELRGGGVRAGLETALDAGARCLCVVRHTILDAFRAGMAGRVTGIFRLGDPGLRTALTREVARPREGRGR